MIVSNRVSVRANVWELPIHGGLVLVRPDIEDLFILNESAAAIWQLTNYNASIESAIAVYCDLYQIGRDAAQSDILSAIRFWEDTLLAPPVRTAVQTWLDPVCEKSLSDFIFEGHYAIDHTLFRVRIYDSELVDDIVPRLKPLRTAPNTPNFAFDMVHEGGLTVLFLNDRRIAAEKNENAVRAIFLQEIAKLPFIERDWLAILHAGACGTQEKCVLLAGASHSGKSTLAAALMHSGLRFLCDDSAALEPGTMAIAKMPFALMLREGSWTALEPRFPQLREEPIVERHGQLVRFLAPEPSGDITGNVPAAALFFSRFDPKAQTKIEPMDPFETLLGLQESGFWVAHNQQSIRKFLDWVQALPAYRLTYSDLDEAVSVVRATAEL